MSEHFKYFFFRLEVSSGNGSHAFQVTAKSMQNTNRAQLAEETYSTQAGRSCNHAYTPNASSPKQPSRQQPSQ
eukprot:202317-Amphidinium_carterae.1